MVVTVRNMFHWNYQRFFDSQKKFDGSLTNLAKKLEGKDAP